MKCEHLDDILEAEMGIIKKNTNNKREIKEYIRDHGEEMRALYCGNVCPDRGVCNLAQKYLRNEND